MNVTAIPRWNDQGVLPPVNPAKPTSSDRSPFRVSLVALIQQFSTSPPRRAILEGFLRYRAELHAIGLIQGFQWLDGSFMENVERLENRSPNDLDVVTFYFLPDGENQETISSRNGEIFSTRHIKKSFRVDGYYQVLNRISLELLVEKATYWSGLWSHRRDNYWKGFLQVDLAPHEDEEAQVVLQQCEPTGEAS